MLGDLSVDPARREVTVKGSPVELRTQEFDLLLVLAENRGLVLSRDKLLELAWAMTLPGKRGRGRPRGTLARQARSQYRADRNRVGVGYKLVV